MSCCATDSVKFERVAHLTETGATDQIETMRCICYALNPHFCRASILRTPLGPRGCFLAWKQLMEAGYDVSCQYNYNFAVARKEDCALRQPDGVIADGNQLIAVPECSMQTYSNPAQH